MLTLQQQKYIAWKLSRKKSASDDDKLTSVLSEARVDLNPHQVDAALFAFRSPLSKGAVLGDEVGLGKTIEAGLVISQHWAERKRNILIISPATLRKQWGAEMEDKFFIPSVIMESKNFNSILNNTYHNPFEQKGRLIICSYQFAKKQIMHIKRIQWDLIVIDEAHKLRNVYKNSNGMAGIIKEALLPFKKILLTATPLQNNIQELHGLVSIIDDNYFGSIDSFTAQYSKVNLRNENTYVELRKRIQPVIHRTLRKQVQEYVKYTRRIPMVQEYYPTEDEAKLYDLISEYLRRDDAYGLPKSQRSLITLILRKLLASSTFAVANTLATIIARLENIVKQHDHQYCLSDKLAEDYEGYSEESDEWSETEEEENDEKEYSEEEIENIKDEIEELKAYLHLALSIASNSKGDCLLLALKLGFEKMDQLGAMQKALIFTESTRTQKYIYELLENNGYKGKVVLFNGSNSDPQSKAIYKSWLNKNANTQQVSGSATADKRQALVDYFKEEASIMIATEAAAEGINLQFCSLLVNYDLPWNPQRVEQRIGRCHRYGQKYDVVVVNFINKSNAADVRVYQLLSDKFKLFDGVFGSSDEVLGSIESGVDFERRMLGIYQTCRSEEEINNAFNHLQEELDESIKQTMSETKVSLMENFDEEVIEKLRIRQEKDELRLSKFQKNLWELTKARLEGYITVENEEQSIFVLNHAPSGVNVPLGRYRLGKQSGLYYNYRISHPLAKWVVEQCRKLAVPVSSLTFDYKNYPFKISMLEAAIGVHGYLMLKLVRFCSLNDIEEQLLITICDKDMNPLEEDFAKRLLELPVVSSNEITINSDIEKNLITIFDEQKTQLIEQLEERNSSLMDEEIQKIEHWTEDNRQELQKSLISLDEEIEIKNKEFMQERNMKKRLAILIEKNALEDKRDNAWKLFDQKKKELKEQKNTLIARLYEMAENEIRVEDGFILEWRINK